MIQITAENCINMLAIADLVHADRLKETAVQFIVAHLSRIYQTEPFEQLNVQMPRLKHLIFDCIQRQNNRALLVDWNGKVQQVQAQYREAEKVRLEHNAANPMDFPWANYVILFAIAIAYVTVNRQTESIGWLVPVLNVIILLACIVAACSSLMRDSFV